MINSSPMDGSAPDSQLPATFQLALDVPVKVELDVWAPEPGTSPNNASTAHKKIDGKVFIMSFGFQSGWFF
jgi:hypothetical protein